MNLFATTTDPALTIERRRPVTIARTESSSASAAQHIPDCGLVPFMHLHRALSVTSFTSLEQRGYAGDDPYQAALGLRERPFAWLSRYHLAEGLRNGRQVVLRRDGDQRTRRPAEGAGRNPHQLLIRAEFPSFELHGDDSSLIASSSAPALVHELVDALSPSDTWSSLNVTAGPEGIVFERPTVVHRLGVLVSDLWLGERLAAVLGARALQRESLTPRFRMPYTNNPGPALAY